MMARVERTFAVDHPAAAGHFPGNPIIPGAVLLSATLDAMAHALGISLLPCTLKAAKFYSPTRPGDTVVIQFTGSAPGSLKFECTVHDRKVLAGQIECSAAPTNPERPDPFLKGPAGASAAIRSRCVSSSGSP